MSDQNRSERSGISVLLSRLPQWLIKATFVLLAVIVLFIVGTTITAITLDKIVYIAGFKFGALSETAGLPEKIVAMTDQECSQLGQDWQVYDPMKGRFPIGAGQNTDVSGNTKSFSVGQEDNEGEYAHQLTIDEMPKHSHGHGAPNYTRSRRCSGGCNSYIGGNTSSAGGDVAHNNIPPYRVLNFCVMQKEESEPSV